MKLVNFSYKAPNGWELRSIYLSDLNLIVGKNSTGKSRLLIILNAFKKMIVQVGPVYFGRFEVEFFTSNGERINYTVDRKNKDEIWEEMKVNGNVILLRDPFGSSLKSIQTGDPVNVHPPSDKLVLHVRRDVYEYPHFEQIIKWSENMHSFKFGNIHASSFLSDGVSSADLTNVKNVVEIYRKLNSQNRDQLIVDLNEVGFEINSVFAKGPEDNEIYIREPNIEAEIRQSQLSQGMFRSISLLIFLNFLAQDEDVSVLLIDDLCEGLDYERSSKLSKLLFRKLAQTKYQLVSTTNDYFLMENVPIKYWNVLSRRESVVTSINSQTHSELFNNFKFTGLSNFDFFSSDYILKNK